MREAEHPLSHRDAWQYRIDEMRDDLFAVHRVGHVPGSEFEIPCEMVLLALGFLGPEPETMLAQLGCELTDRGNVKVGPDYQTSVPGVFSCGDKRRGQSLVVWAIWEGREAARGVDAWLMGETALPTSPEL